MASRMLASTRTNSNWAVTAECMTRQAWVRIFRRNMYACATSARHIWWLRVKQKGPQWQAIIQTTEANGVLLNEDTNVNGLKGFHCNLSSGLELWRFRDTRSQRILSWRSCRWMKCCHALLFNLVPTASSAVITACRVPRQIFQCVNFKWTKWTFDRNLQTPTDSSTVCVQVIFAFLQFHVSLQSCVHG